MILMFVHSAYKTCKNLTTKDKNDHFQSSHAIPCVYSNRDRMNEAGTRFWAGAFVPPFIKARSNLRGII